MKSACARCVEELGLLDLMVRLLDSAQQCLTAAASDTATENPKYVIILHFFGWSASRLLYITLCFIDQC